MSSFGARKRATEALHHRAPDRIPIDLGATVNSSIHVEAYRHLRAHLGLPPAEPKIVNRMMCAAKVDEDVHQVLGTDFRGVFRGQSSGTEILDEHSYRDDWGVVREKDAGVRYFEQREFPLAGPISKQDILSYKWPDPDDPGIVRGLKEQVRELSSADALLVLNLPAPFVHQSQFLRGFEDWYKDCARNHVLATTLYDAVLEVTLSVAENVLAEVGDMVDVLATADDLGTQRGPQVSPKYFRGVLKPRLKRYFDLLHRQCPGKKVFFHSCGGIEPLLEDLLDIGVDIINPVQVTAQGMDSRHLGDTYGGRVAFWGAVDTQKVLCSGTLDEVRREVESRIMDLGRTGGYVLGAVHNIQPGVPPENVVAMFEWAKTYSRQFYSRG